VSCRGVGGAGGQYHIKKDRRNIKHKDRRVHALLQRLRHGAVVGGEPADVGLERDAALLHLLAQQLAPARVLRWAEPKMK
jgi:hypothetical protein